MSSRKKSSVSLNYANGSTCPSQIERAMSEKGKGILKPSAVAASSDGSLSEPLIYYWGSCLLASADGGKKREPEVLLQREK